MSYIYSTDYDLRLVTVMKDFGNILLKKNFKCVRVLFNLNGKEGRGIVMYEKPAESFNTFLTQGGRFEQPRVAKVIFFLPAVFQGGVLPSSRAAGSSEFWFNCFWFGSILY